MTVVGQLALNHPGEVQARSEPDGTHEFRFYNKADGTEEKLRYLVRRSGSDWVLDWSVATTAADAGKAKAWVEETRGAMQQTRLKRGGKVVR